MTTTLVEQNKGINIKDALSILSARSKAGGENLSSHRNVIPRELTDMGQKIDIMDQLEFTKTDSFKCECANENSAQVDENIVKDDQQHEAIKQERLKRGKEIQSTLQSLSVTELLGTIFAAQEERVATYKIFDQGLSSILLSGNITTYPALCAKVTATFSVLSDTVNAVKSSLIEQHKRHDIARIVTQLQKYEGEKLNLTAAIHLEKLRLKNSDLGLSFNGSDERSARLLEKGIQNLEKNISTNIEAINEMIEELRCIAVDETQEA
ncbi:hypothetical protein HJC23_005609 [Cyclotella cryptica]|uniref:Uncharacterized protein n=1 Tax=Cyclotella cryptica TaxID=29204 RepID=A0ABD3PYM2_9STRA